ncbi:MAG: c-type cytochrome [Anaerolineae bacterium]|nr:c-type cytochrome [Anaerolineae bacterium]
MRSERIAVSLVIIIMAGLPLLVFGYQALRSSIPGIRVIDIVGYAPASRRWQPETIRVHLGERVRLRIYGQDVVHGLAVPALNIDVPEILPGHVEEVEFVADRLGRFPFACTRWCSTDHWRMRGTIEVVDPTQPNSWKVSPAEPPLFQQLQLDPDAMRTPVAGPPDRPSASHGSTLTIRLPAELRDRDWLRAHSPVETFARLRRDASLRPLSDTETWDLVASAWQKETPVETLRQGQQLYARDCAACHGEAGQGDGPAGRDLPGMATMHPGMASGPTNFTVTANMFSASDALLQGKVLRGGMGTGMPEWGSLYSDEELWAVVSFLRTFGFDVSPTR